MTRIKQHSLETSWCFEIERLQANNCAVFNTQKLKTRILSANSIVLSVFQSLVLRTGTSTQENFRRDHEKETANQHNENPHSRSDSNAAREKEASVDEGAKTRLGMNRAQHRPWTHDDQMAGLVAPAEPRQKRPAAAQLGVEGVHRLHQKLNHDQSGDTADAVRITLISEMNSTVHEWPWPTAAETHAK